jgi:hypothetical protein
MTSNENAARLVTRIEEATEDATRSLTETQAKIASRLFEGIAIDTMEIEALMAAQENARPWQRLSKAVAKAVAGDGDPFVVVTTFIDDTQLELLTSGQAMSTSLVRVAKSGYEIAANQAFYRKLSQMHERFSA